MDSRGVLFLSSALVFAAVLFGSGEMVLGQEELCPFTNGSCPITLDNTIDVFFHDVDDRFSCQKMCRDIDDCHFFTMMPVTDAPKDHMKCFHFKTCDYLDPCATCTSGPELPIIDDCEPNHNITCETSLTNTVDIYYFDVTDHDSCQHQCQILPDCNFWTLFDVSDSPRPHNECWLFKDCQNTEPCKKCETGNKF